MKRPKFKPGDTVKIGVTVSDRGYETTTCIRETPTVFRGARVLSASSGDYPYTVVWKTAYGHYVRGRAVEHHLCARHRTGGEP